MLSRFDVNTNKLHTNDIMAGALLKIVNRVKFGCNAILRYDVSLCTLVHVSILNEHQSTNTKN